MYTYDRYMGVRPTLAYRRRDQATSPVTTPVANT